MKHQCLQIHVHDIAKRNFIVLWHCRENPIQLHDIQFLNYLVPLSLLLKNVFKMCWKCVTIFVFQCKSPCWLESNQNTSMKTSWHGLWYLFDPSTKARIATWKNINIVMCLPKWNIPSISLQLNDLLHKKWMNFNWLLSFEGEDKYLFLY